MTLGIAGWNRELFVTAEGKGLVEQVGAVLPRRPADRTGLRSFALTCAARDVLLREDSPVRLTARAAAKLAEARDVHLHAVPAAR